MKNEDKMIDALLKEHARNGADHDDSFLEKVEKRLDADESTDRLTAESGLSKRSAKTVTWGLGMAAALTIGVVGYYGWKLDKEQALAMNDEYVVEGLVADAESPIAASIDSSQPIPAQAKGKDSLKMNLADAEMAEDAEASAQPSKINERKLDSTKLGSLVKPAEMQIPAAPGRAALSARKKSKAPAVALGKVVAADRISGGIQAPVAGSLKKRNALSSRNFGDGDHFGDGWGGGGRGDLREAPERDHSWHGRGYRPEKPTPADKASGNRYGQLVDNTFLSPWKAPLSTFSVDVDTASYTNIRKLIQSGQPISADAVRIEEMINYFNYAYPQPDGQHPFSVNVETASCPWNSTHRLVKIGLQGKEIIREKRPSANLVFLLDVSGSMNNQDKLPLLIDSMKILLKELNGDDSVSIVVYAGAQGLALPPTHVDAQGRKKILKTLTNLHSGGSTNGGSGIKLAYKIAKKHFVKGGVNRVILGSDGDFNVGLTDNAALISLVERQAKSGVFLSVLGFGQGNLNDSMLEEITNKGNGNYAYIDNLREGRKVFLDDMMGTIVTIAKDVKIQVEFNPAKVSRYRLIGYANRMLKAEDFKNKRIDAGEIGAGHTVTAFYEVVPGNAGDQPVVDGLKYQKNKPTPKPAMRKLVESDELMTVKLAYKQPNATKETESTYFNTAVTDSGKNWNHASADFKFASSVALFGMLQRQSNEAGQGGYAMVKKLAEEGRGDDPKGLRTEFSDLMRKVK